MFCENILTFGLGKNSDNLLLFSMHNLKSLSRISKTTDKIIPWIVHKMVNYILALHTSCQEFTNFRV